jgi:hypothetical protein
VLIKIGGMAAAMDSSVRRYGAKTNSFGGSRLRAQADSAFPSNQFDRHTDLTS